MDEKKKVRILYTNYRGETSIRNIIPKSIKFCATEWHPREQWLLEAYDIDKKVDRSFAIRDITEWSEEK